MSSPSPLQLRVSLAHVDRGLELVSKLIVDRDPETPPEHVILRALAWCLFHQDGLRLADGPPRRDVPDLAIVSAELKAVTWIACGAADAEEIRRVVAHNRGVRVETLFDAPAPLERFLHQLGGVKKRPPGFEELGIASIERDAVTRLAAREELRQRWAVTIVADHIYVDSDGVKAESPVSRFAVPPFSG
ncbi:MAG TPA: YaeQ family protein [Polyangia bacterium]|nr:YaeQ family protein [Polyangia bacterium]